MPHPSLLFSDYFALISENPFKMLFFLGVSIQFVENVKHFVVVASDLDMDDSGSEVPLDNQGI